MRRQRQEETCLHESERDDIVGTFASDCWEFSRREYDDQRVAQLSLPETGPNPGS